MHTHTFKVRWVTGLGFQAMAPLEAIMAWHTAIWLLLIHGANFMLAHISVSMLACSFISK